MRRFSKEEIGYLRERLANHSSFPAATIKDIAEKLNRSEGSIRMKLSSLRVKTVRVVTENKREKSLKRIVSDLVEKAISEVFEVELAKLRNENEDLKEQLRALKDVRAAVEKLQKNF